MRRPARPATKPKPPSWPRWPGARDAAKAHRRGDYGRAVDLLYPARGSIRRIGGSHAQRDFFMKMLIDAAVKAGRVEIARSLLGERLATRPRNAWGQAMAAQLS